MLDWQDRTALVAARDRHLHGRLQQPLSDDAIAYVAPPPVGGRVLCRRSLPVSRTELGSYDLRFAARGWRPLFGLTARLLPVLAPLLRRGIPYLQKRGMLPRNVYL